MRVAVLAHSFPRFPGDTHGPFVQRLSESLADQGHQVWVLVPFDPELSGHPGSPLELRSFRYVWPDRAHLLGYSRTLKRDIGLKLWAYLEAPLYHLFAERALARLVRREGIELLHAHWILPNGFIAARVARRFGLPLAITLHGSDVFMAEANPLFGRMARGALAAASHVTTCSPELGVRLATLGRPEDERKIRVVANGSDLDPELLGDAATAAESMRQRLGAAPDEPLVVAVGRMVDKKGFPDLIEAAASFLAEHPRARLVLGGGGDLQPTLEAQARALPVAERILFTGGLSHPDVLALIAAGDVFVMPSIRDRRGNVDGLPIVVLEAMAAGKPVVATDVSGIPLAVQAGKTGLLVPEKSPEALAAAISELLADPVRAATLGAEGRRRVRHELNWGAIAAEHDRLYRQAAAGGGR
ncbi:MAG TPA: glycosyltransferase [Thermoanaerobaculia bacterium]|nr:glycosyltransferase [Thermoanaerobaculia bacterium]